MGMNFRGIYFDPPQCVGAGPPSEPVRSLSSGLAGFQCSIGATSYRVVLPVRCSRIRKPWVVSDFNDRRTVGSVMRQCLEMDFTVSKHSPRRATWHNTLNSDVLSPALSSLE